MSTYNWTGITQNGLKVSGSYYATSIEHLKTILKNQNIFPLQIKTKLHFNFTRKIRAKNIESLIEQLDVLMNANTPLITALNVISQSAQNIHVKNLITTCTNTISSGQSLSQTLKRYPKYFSELICSLINVGEQSGTLDIMLHEIAMHLAKTSLQKRKIIKALLYPAAVLGITFIVTSILLIFVVPQFKIMFAGFGAKLPPYTQSIIACGDFIKTYWKIIFCMVAGLVFAAKLAHSRSEKFRHFISDLVLKIPIVKNILTFAIIARITKTLGLTFKSGIPLLKALAISADTANHWRYQLALQNAAKIIAGGKPLHRALVEQNLFPQKVIQLIALGEETGTLDKMLEKIATIYNDELAHLTDNLNNLLEPVIMVILGIIVGGIIIGMYLPIFQLGNAV